MSKLVTITNNNQKFLIVVTQQLESDEVMN